MNETNWKNHLIASLIASVVASSYSDSHNTSLAFAADNQNQNSTSQQNTDEMTDADCWKIAGENFGSFGTMLPSTIEKLFGSSRVTNDNKASWEGMSCQHVRLDNDTELELSRTIRLIDEISLIPTNQDTKAIHLRLNDEFEYDWQSDTEYTYASRPSDDQYWAVVKTNFKNLLGNTKEELKKLLGPERCSSESKHTVDYRIGNQRLRFYLNNNRVSFLKLVTDKYGKENWFQPKVTPAKPHRELWPIFQTQIDRLPGMTTEKYESLVQNSREKEAANSKSAQSSSNRPRQHDYKIDKWQLDDRISSTVFLQHGFVQSIDFEPIEITEDRKQAHGLVRIGWGDSRPNEEDAVYTGAKRRDEATYWAAIKPNLQKLIGMKRQEILALLGPERCSSEAGKSIDYRVGNSRLRFFLRKDTVIGFELKNDMYLHDT
ncbi:MAG: hypothetical protein K2X81_05595 [Candidatus Obscuribacterales bacterium]|nr:hypothetical protein [Candidatus Obscuribacterales bacterium]